MITLLKLSNSFNIFIDSIYLLLVEPPLIFIKCLKKNIFTIKRILDK